VLTCCLGVLTPLPGATTDRVNAIAPRSLVNCSAGSVGSNAIG